jgi:hypothetical protein
MEYAQAHTGVVACDGAGDAAAAHAQAQGMTLSKSQVPNNVQLPRMHMYRPVGGCCGTCCSTELSLQPKGRLLHW